MKQAIIARALAFRSEAPALFAAGAYQKLRIEGPRADHVLAFARMHEGRAAIVVATRLAATMPGLIEGPPLVTKSAWAGTAIAVPRHMQGRRITDVLGERHAAEFQHGGISARLPVADVLHALPVALLEVG